MIKKIINLIKKIIDYYNEIRHIQKARSLAFTILATILPLLLLINITLSLLPNKIYNLVDQYTDFNIDDIDSLLVSSMITSDSHFKTILVIGIIITVIVSVVFQMQFIIQLINDMYEFKEKRPYLKEITTSIVIFLLLLFSIVYISAFMYFGSFLVFILKNFDLLDRIIDIIKNIYLVKNIFFLLGVFMLVTLIYKIVPYKKVKFKTIMPGALFTTLAIFIGSYIFDWYRLNFKTYDFIYGDYASFYLMLLWIYIISNIIIISLAINAFLYRRDKWSVDETIIIKR